MTIVRGSSVHNASVTRLDRVDDAWRLVTFDDVAHLAEVGAPVTEHEGTDDTHG